MATARPSGSSHNKPAPDDPQEDVELSPAFERTVDEGERRLTRTWPGLLATGTVGGIDVSVGLFALFVVHHETGNPLLAGLAFGIGFIALTLGNSELFTENFLVPIAAVVARQSSVGSLMRLWAGTLVTNLVGGWVVMGLVVLAEPGLARTILEVAVHYDSMGIGRRSFALAVLGGMIITLMTWMERSTTSVPAKIVSALSAAFLLAAGALNHAIVVSLIMFAALHVGAPFGYLDWLKMLGWASAGNILGGVGLVTMLRLVQVGVHKIEEEAKY